ncbi:MAG TPA: SUMF1/EgtB/PvdO family nonheme iron enzyme, partial [Nitrospiraceae bacterium]|nr:SUMF1/EgtB/PvdO family nonheme iron enzyme [Nitrospiraceae bacterium]
MTVRSGVVVFLTGFVMVLIPVFSHAAESQAAPTEFTGNDGAPMILIPAGSFPMGVPPGDRDGGPDEYPRHEVFVDSFYMDKYEVTNGRYLTFVKATDHRVP